MSNSIIIIKNKIFSSLESIIKTGLLSEKYSHEIKCVITNNNFRKKKNVEIFCRTMYVVLNTHKYGVQVHCDMVI